MKPLTALLILAGATAGVAVGAAPPPPLRVTLQPAVLVGTPDSSPTLRGSLRNTSANPVFLTGARLQVTGTGISADDSVFLTKAPEQLAASAKSALLPLGKLTLEKTAAPGAYKCDLTIFGGPHRGNQQVVAQIPFTVRIDPAKAPSR